MPRRSLRAHQLVSPSNQTDRGAKPAPSSWVQYWCALDHQTLVRFAADAPAPDAWSCKDCGGPSALVRGTAPAGLRPRVFPRTPYEFLMMRRTEAEGDRLLAEAVADLRRRQRAEGKASNRGK
jgi:hypothetical protein